jgi:hypothetical protein
MSELNDFINAQHERDLLMTERFSRIAQSQEDMSARLFGGPNQKGMLTYMIEMAAETSKELRTDIKLIETRTGALESWKRSSKSWIGGAVAVLSLESMALGVYFNRIAGHVQNAASLLKK